MNVILHQRFVDRLKALLDEMRLSQAECARRMGIPRQSLTKYLSGQTCPGLDVVDRFAEALGVDPLTLLQSDQPAVRTPTKRRA